MRSEEDRVRNMMADRDDARRAGNKLVFDPRSKTLRSVSYSDPDNATLEVEKSDMDHFFVAITKDAS